ncbi:MAG: hypothetical protein ACLQDV_03470 [Candidatus Binataceae bacterium]
MHSWDALPDEILEPAGDVTRAFLRIGVRDYRAAARHLNHLPYGRNSSRTETLAVLREGHGTCSTKHALLKELAIEQKLEVALVIGIYEMTERNTPGVGRVLAKYRLAYVPEAHCYLRYREDRVDVTRALADGPSEPITLFLHEEEIALPQVGDYKVGLHQSFIRNWIARNPEAAGGRSFDEIWRIREECIAALSA